MIFELREQGIKFSKFPSHLRSVSSFNHFGLLHGRLDIGCAKNARFISQCLQPHSKARDFPSYISVRFISSKKEPVSIVKEECESVLAHGLLSTKDPVIPYRLGHAWQHGFLNNRLKQLRHQPNDILQYLSVAPTDSIALPQNVHHDRILLFEHAPVYTLGRGADEGNLVFLNNSADKDAADFERRRLSRTARGVSSARLSSKCLITGLDYEVTESESSLILKNYLTCDKLPPPVRSPNGADIFRIERGGEVTFHGPGQLVVYPLLDLRRKPFRQDLHWYLRQVEQVIIETLFKYGVKGARDEINIGVWVGQNKICAVGISSSRWITTHGFALNVNPDLSFFDTSFIIPCGIEGRGVTSLAVEMNRQGLRPPPMLHVANEILTAFETVFGVKTYWDKDLTSISPDDPP